MLTAMMAKLSLIRYFFSLCRCSCNNDYLLIAQMRDDVEGSALVLACGYQLEPC